MSAPGIAGAAPPDRRTEVGAALYELGDEANALDDIGWTASLLGDHAATNAQEPELWAHAFRALSRAIEARAEAIRGVRGRLDGLTAG